MHELTPEQQRAFFRFDEQCIRDMQEVLGIPTFIKLPNRSVVPGLEVLCLTLRRMAYPSRWLDIQLLFRRYIGTLSRMFMWCCEHLYKRCRKRQWYDHQLSCETQQVK